MSCFVMSCLMSPKFSIKSILPFLLLSALIIACNNANDTKNVVKGDLELAKGIGPNCLSDTALMIYLDSFINETTIAEDTRGHQLIYTLFFRKNEQDDTSITITAGIGLTELIDDQIETKGACMFNGEIVIIADNKDDLNAAGSSYYNADCLVEVDSLLGDGLINQPYQETDVYPFRYWDLKVRNKKISEISKLNPMRTKSQRIQ